LFVAYFLAKETGVVTADAPLARLGQIATAKASTGARRRGHRRQGPGHLLPDHAGAGGAGEGARFTPGARTVSS